ncbi:hypothetical protein RSAG8_01224, partial [Rhizoctonia solani AG-8 WAC10335]
DAVPQQEQGWGCIARLSPRLIISCDSDPIPAQRAHTCKYGGQLTRSEVFLGLLDRDSYGERASFVWHSMFCTIIMTSEDREMKVYAGLIRMCALRMLGSPSLDMYLLYTTRAPRSMTC